MATKRLIAAVFAATLLGAPWGGRAQTEPTGQAPDPAQLSAAPLVIGSGDLINVSIYDSPELSGHFRVDHKGDVELPLVDSIHVAGLTADRAAKLIQSQYVQAQILLPETSRPTVFVEEYANQGITVSGEVKTPGIYPAFGVRMLNDVLTAAGGTLPTASSKITITRRDDPQNPVTLDYNPEASPREKSGVQLFPGDTVRVPRAGIVYVLGNVNKSGGFVLDGRDTITAEKAMALAGGTGRAASLRKVQLVRSVQGGQKIMVIVPLDRIIAGKAADVALRDGDILFVPTSRGKLATQQAITSALGIGTSVTIYKTAY